MFSHSHLLVYYNTFISSFIHRYAIQPFKRQVAFDYSNIHVCKFKRAATARRDIPMFMKALRRICKKVMFLIEIHAESNVSEG